MRKHVFIAMPTRTGMCPIDSQIAYMDLNNTFASLGWTVTWSVSRGSCYIDHVRNHFVRLFLESGADELFFVDDDVAWEPGSARRLFSHDVDVVAGIYSMRQDPIRFPACRWSPDDMPDENGLLKMKYVPAGFMRITRKAIMELMDAYPHEVYNCTEHGKEILVPKLFWVETIKDEGDVFQKLVSEDAYFCRLYQGIGGTVYGDAWLRFSHFGTKEWNTRYADFIPGYEMPAAA
jgi:hypothetical protein